MDEPTVVYEGEADGDRSEGVNYLDLFSGIGGFPKGMHAAWLDGWEDGVPRLATGIPHRVDRLRGLGNSIVPQIAELIFAAIAEAERVV